MIKKKPECPQPPAAVRTSLTLNERKCNVRHVPLRIAESNMAKSIAYTHTTHTQQQVKNYLFVCSASNRRFHTLFKHKICPCTMLHACYADGFSLVIPHSKHSIRLKHVSHVIHHSEQNVQLNII